MARALIKPRPLWDECREKAQAFLAQRLPRRGSGEALRRPSRLKGACRRCMCVLCSGAAECRPLIVAAVALSRRGSFCVRSGAFPEVRVERRSPVMGEARLRRA